MNRRGGSRRNGQRAEFSSMTEDNCKRKCSGFKQRASGRERRAEAFSGHFQLQALIRYTYRSRLRIDWECVNPIQQGVTILSNEHMLERKNELLRRNIQQYLLQENQHGLSHQEQHFLQHLIKEMHQNNYEMNRQS
ncbi:hypothetical protein WJ0W_001989 [Paenibacillus melissococcoides]|uniref:IDEAL domain-containing protein n=1 Tax=Paenibacillus melissococcoides TaxID=2912268 RepID=A0ABM9FZJ9_9BACL|nr:hypothetical protein WJ0W_001989 [Paenibacillus melissococcoides]